MPVARPKPVPHRSRARVKDGHEGLSEQHEAFAQAVASGSPAVQAYRKHVAEPETCYETCCVEACTLMRRPNVAKRVGELRKSFKDFLDQELGLRQETVVKYLVDAMYTPHSEITPDHHLCAGVTPGKFGDKIEAVDKLGATGLLLSMTGWKAPEKTELTVHSHEEIESAMEKIYGRAKPLPKKGKRR